MKNKKFDCVKMKNAAAKKVWAEIGKLSVPEQLVYWAKQREILKKKIEEARKKSKTKAKTQHRAVA